MLFYYPEKVLPESHITLGLKLAGQWFVVTQQDDAITVCSFICQVALVMRQRSDLCGLRVKLPPATAGLTTQR